MPGDSFRAPSLAEAEVADKVALQEIFTLCLRGAKLDDAISTVVLDRDMLRHLLAPRPKLPTLLNSGAKRGRDVNDRKGNKQKKPRTGECHKAMEGKCRDENCPCSHKCALCNSRKHFSTACPKAPLQE